MFDFLITPWIIRFLYVIGQLIVIIASFALADEMFYGDEEIIMGFLFSILSVPLWRMTCESLIVIFRISENISIIAASDTTNSPLSISKTKIVFSNIKNPDLYINKKAYDLTTKNYIGKIAKVDLEKGNCLIKKDFGTEEEKGITEILVNEL